jgi:hypothetical protein
MELEALPEAQRCDFIKKKSHIWRAFARYLARMSYGKCWYSETRDPQSFFDVDHFRPKAEAIRSETVKDDGYPWLHFLGKISVTRRSVPIVQVRTKTRASSSEKQLVSTSRGNLP